MGNWHKQHRYITIHGNSCRWQGLLFVVMLPLLAVGPLNDGGVIATFEFPTTFTIRRSQQHLHPCGRSTTPHRPMPVPGRTTVPAYAVSVEKRHAAQPSLPGLSSVRRRVSVSITPLPPRLNVRPSYRKHPSSVAFLSAFPYWSFASFRVYHIRIA